MLREQKYHFKLKIEFRYKVFETHINARMEQANGKHWAHITYEKLFTLNLHRLFIDSDWIWLLNRNFGSRHSIETTDCYELWIELISNTSTYIMWACASRLDSILFTSFLLSSSTTWNTFFRLCNRSHNYLYCNKFLLRFK